MAFASSSAYRAAEFMRQCRLRQSLSTFDPSKTTTRAVSSSHLAPSNFSKQTRRRDTEIEYPRFSKPSTPRHNLPPRQRQPQPSPLGTDKPIPAGFISFLKYRILNLSPPAPPPHKPPPFNVLNNPWRAKKKWPPDFDSMHPKQQFHFEKTFRRRMVLKTDSKRYNWNRYVRLVQQSLIIVTAVYFLFIADPYKKEGGGTPVDGFRAWFFGQIAKFEHMPQGLRESALELKDYYQENWKKAPWVDGDGDEASPVGDAHGSVEGKKETV